MSSWLKAYRMTLVSKNGLSFIDLFAIEFEIRREGPLHLTELLERPLFRPVTGHLEVAFTCDGNLDFVSLFEIEGFDNYSWKTNGQTVAPFGNLHKDIPNLLYIHKSQEARFLPSASAPMNCVRAFLNFSKTRINSRLSASGED